MYRQDKFELVDSDFSLYPLEFPGHDAAVEFADETQGYHNCGGNGFKSAIDHILVRGAEDGFVRRFERFSPEYYLPLSDHSPVFVDVEL